MTTKKVRGPEGWLDNGEITNPDSKGLVVYHIIICCPSILPSQYQCVRVSSDVTNNTKDER